MTWQKERNEANITINWRFTTDNARIKLKRLYPVIEQEHRTFVLFQMKVVRALGFS
jgi:hypothetical protein